MLSHSVFTLFMFIRAGRIQKDVSMTSKVVLSCIMIETQTGYLGFTLLFIQLTKAIANGKM